jgi:hypothetical protein
VMALLQGIKNLFGPLLMTWTADSPTRRYGESIFDYEYLHEFEAKIETARKLVCGTYADLNYAKTSENSVHCHVPLIKFFWG